MTIKPDWMQKAVRAAHSFKAVTRRKPGARHSVYVILLNDPRRREPWGLYVGQTSRDPDWRFDQHKAGYKPLSPERQAKCVQAALSVSGQSRVIVHTAALVSRAFCTRSGSSMGLLGISFLPILE